MAGIAIFYLLIIVVTIAAMWRVFEKAGQPGWACIIPIYNYYIWTKIIKKPGYWVVLMIFISIIWLIWAINLLSKSFGKGVGFTLGLIFLPFIFYPILAWGDAKYQWGDKTLSSDPNVLDAGAVK